MIAVKVKLQNGGERDFVNFSETENPGRLFVVEQLGDYRGKVVLDVGCGTHKCVPEAIGIDIKPVTDIRASAEKLDFKNDSVDIIISRHCFEHLLDPVQVLEEWIRILKPGGKIIFVLPDHAKIDTMQYVIGGGIHLHAYTSDSLKRLLGRFPELEVSEVRVVTKDWSFGAVATLKSCG